MDPKLTPCDNQRLAGILVPDPDQATQDDANQAPCWGTNPDGTAKLCQLGSTSGARKRLLAIGDSHNNALIGVYQQIADANQWEIDVAGKGGCYLTEATQQQLSTADQTACERWRHEVIKFTTATNYDAIIVTHSAYDNRVIPPAGQTVEQYTIAGLVQAWKKLPDIPIFAIRDNPSMPVSELACVSSHRESAAKACPVAKHEALMFDGQAQAAEEFAGRVQVIDLTSYYCTATICPPVIGHVLVYRDPSHLTATYAKTLFPYINQPIVAQIR